MLFADVTQRTLAEQALREADRRKDEFLAMLAHELRNPLAAIRNAVQILLRKEATHRPSDRLPKSWTDRWGTWSARLMTCST